MSLDSFIKQIKDTPESIEFDALMAIINEYYNYTPTAFSNGLDDDKVFNEAGTNEGSCKIFTFARLHQLNKDQTLNCFGKYYREDVLLHPDNTDHANIRTFIKHGWDGIAFQGEALGLK